MSMAIPAVNRIPEIAAKCKADPKGMRLLLQALVGLGLLVRREARFWNRPLGRRYLDRRSPTSIA